MPTFGSLDIIQDQSGNALANVQVKLYGSLADAKSQVNLLASATTNSKGQWPVTVTGYDMVWVRDPAGNIWSVPSDTVASDHAARLAALESGPAPSTSALDAANAFLIGTSSSTQGALNGRYVGSKGGSAEFFAEAFKTGGASDLAAIQAACAAATAFASGAVVKLSARAWDVGTGLSMSGYSCTLEGTGASFVGGFTAGVGFNTTNAGGTVIKATSQAGPVISLDGWLTPSSFRGRLSFGGFTIVGSGLADATQANTGITSGTGSGITNAIGNLHFHDIVISGTGGPCLYMDSVYLCEFSRVTLTDPVSATANNVPWAKFRNIAGCNFYGLGFQSLRGGQASAGLGGGVGACGALVCTSDDLYRSGVARFWGTWFQNLHLPANGTFIDSDADAMEFRGTYFVDQGLDVAGVNTGTSWVRLNGVGNIWDGYVPDGGGTGMYASGIVVSGSRNRITGTGGYANYSVELVSGAQYNYVEIGGSQGLPNSTTGRVLNNSGNITNVIIDNVYGMGTYPGWQYVSTNLGPQFMAQSNNTQGFVRLGNGGVKLGGSATSGFVDANQFQIRNTGQTQAFTFDTTPGSGAGLFLPNFGALGTATSAQRSKIAVVQGATGVPDHIYIARKNQADVYEWQRLDNVTSVVTKTTSYSLLTTDDIVVFNGTTLTATLPDPTTVVVGRHYVVKNINASSVTVNSAGSSKTLDGAASLSLAQWAVGRYVSDGTQWLTV